MCTTSSRQTLLATLILKIIVFDNAINVMKSEPMMDSQEIGINIFSLFSLCFCRLKLVHIHSPFLYEKFSIAFS